MASIDVLSDSNWYNVIASSISNYSLGGVGWTGSAWHSEGKVFFDTCSSDYGIRVETIGFTLNIYNPGYCPGAPAISPTMLVKITSGATVYTGNVTGLSSVALSPYDETINTIDSITFKSYSSWSSYSYGNDGDGGDNGPYHIMRVEALTLNYAEPGVPYLWQDYVNTAEITL